MNVQRFLFPKNFLWGAATSAYQIEGATREDGRGESIWDRFCKTPKKIAGGHTGDVACDHYNRWKEDIELMSVLGLKSYRFSIAWPRVIPDGTGKVNTRGLDFYQRLVDELLKRNIEPVITIYHWDLPQKLEDMGGWPWEGIVNYYLKYAEVLFKALGDRVKYWITFNEPHVFCFYGYGTGQAAPGRKNLKDAVKAALNVMKSHRETYHLFKSLCKGKITIALNLYPCDPLNIEKDWEAAQTASFCFNEIFLDPLFKGEFGKNAEFYIKKGLITEEPPDLRGTIDFLGVNYYTRYLIKQNLHNPLGFDIVKSPLPKTEMEWEIYPEGLYRTLVWLKNEYSDIEIMITENGAAFNDVLKNNQVLDFNRIKFLWEHFLRVYEAMRDGVKVIGYQVWSLMDNFEWTHGYYKRFGLVYVDYENNLKRTIKASGWWYSDVIRHNGVEIQPPVSSLDDRAEIFWRKSSR